MTGLTDDEMAEYVRGHRCHAALGSVTIADWDRGIAAIEHAARADAERERDKAYRDRAELVAVLARTYPSSMERADPSPGFEHVVYVDLPTGQVSWHVADADLDLFEGVATSEGRTWDGHDDAEKSRRLSLLSTADAEREVAALRDALARLWDAANDYRHAVADANPYLDEGLPSARSLVRALGKAWVAARHPEAGVATDAPAADVARRLLGLGDEGPA